MTIDIGRMNKRVTIMKYADVDTEYNTTKKNEPLKTIWASVEPVSGKEIMEGAKIESEITYKIFIRYMQGIKPDMLVEYKGRIFEIKYIINYREKNETLQLMCTEKSKKAGDINVRHTS